MALLLGAAAYVLGVQSSTGQHAEDAALQASTLNYDPGFPLSLVSPAFVFFAVAVLAVLGAIRWGFSRAVVVVVASLGAVALSQVLKQKILVRPDFWELGADNTFPSGHATIFAVLALGLVVIAPQILRGFMSVCAAAALALVGTQILLNGWHRPSDVFGAIMLALVCYCVMLSLLPAKAHNYAPGAGIAAFVLALTTGIAALVALLLAGYAWLASAHSAALWAGIFAVIAASCYGCKTVAGIVRYGKKA